MKTAGQSDGQVLFTASQFARWPALNEPPVLGVLNAEMCRAKYKYKRESITSYSSFTL